jgi:CRISPR/Cas system-associated protein endoribonuclease Cas2
VLKKPVSLIWPGRKIEEDFVKSFLKTGFDMLQHSTTMIKLED